MTSWADAIASAISAAQDAAGEAISYKRGADSRQIVAVRTRSRNVQQGGEASLIEYSELNWLIKASDLPYLPESGDTIEDASANTWRVLPNSGQPPYEAVDPDETLLSVRVKRV